MASFKRKKVTRNRHWSNVPPDIIRRIMEKLCWVDRIRLPFVCTTWFVSVPRGLPVDPEFPWLLNLVHKHDKEDQHTVTQLQLFDPLKKKRYRIREGIHTFGCTTIWCSRLGWLLLRNIGDRVYCDDDFVGQTFLFSPLTGEVIKLPKLENIYWEYKDVATFSMSVICPECTVFVCWRNWNSAGIKTCRVGDNTWKSFELLKGSGSQYFLETDDYLYPVDAIYLAGSFYCLFRDGEVSVFNLQLQQWEFLEQFGPRPEFSKYKFVRSSTSTDLLLCKFDYGIAQIWRYDFTKKSWINEKDSNSGNRMIFLDYNIGSGFPLVASELADKVPMLNDKCYEPLNGKSGNIQFCSERWLRSFDENVKIYSKKLEQREMQIIWFDHRLVWRKSDLLPHS
ncbi:hypothetical protein SLA2020_128670 [Shorea laevis]